ncbi:MAG: hypothetical protein ABSB18_00115 [Candidatus Omnitrophota bacterium]
MGNKRPAGINLIIGINFFMGIFLIGLVFQAIIKNPHWIFSLLALAFVIIPYLLFAAYFIQLGFFTFKLRIKARKENIIFAIFGILVLGIVFVVTLKSYPDKILYYLGRYIVLSVGIIYFIWEIYYLTRSEIREQFGRMGNVP